MVIVYSDIVDSVITLEFLDPRDTVVVSIGALLEITPSLGDPFIVALGVEPIRDPSLLTSRLELLLIKSLILLDEILIQHYLFMKHLLRLPLASLLLTSSPQSDRSRLGIGTRPATECDLSIGPRRRESTGALIILTGPDNLETCG